MLRFVSPVTYRVSWSRADNTAFGGEGMVMRGYDSLHRKQGVRWGLSQPLMASSSTKLHQHRAAAANASAQAVSFAHQAAQGQTNIKQQQHRETHQHTTPHLSPGVSFLSLPSQGVPGAYLYTK